MQVKRPKVVRDLVPRAGVAAEGRQRAAPLGAAQRPRQRRRRRRRWSFGRDDRAAAAALASFWRSLDGAARRVRRS